MRPEAQDPDLTSAKDPKAAGQGVRVQTRPLGELGESISALGLGCGPLTRAEHPMQPEGPPRGDVPEPDWKGTIAAALDCGVHVVDMAQRMLRPLSEERLGPTIQGVRDELFLSTRCTPLDGKPFDTSEAAVRGQLEDSLRRLRTDRIDLYQVHDVEAAHPERLLDVTLPALVAARERGEVRYIGASGDSLELLEEIVISFPVDAILSYARFDLANSDLAESLLPLAAERGVAVINAAPLHMGLLSNPEHAREVASADRPAGLAAERAFEIAQRAGADLPRLALEYAAQDPRIACTLVGCATPEEVRRNARAFGTHPTELEAKAIDEIRAVFRDADH